FSLAVTLPTLSLFPYTTLFRSRVSIYGVAMLVLCQNEILVRLHEPLHPFVLKPVYEPRCLYAFLLMLVPVLLARYVYSVEFENRKNHSHHKRWYILLVSSVTPHNK